VVSTRGLTTELSGSLSPPPIDPLRAAAGQRLLAEETGGDAVVNSNDFRAAFERFVRDNSTYYMLGYAPSSERADGRFHNIQVIVRRPGVTVRARRGYYADRVRGVDAPLAVSQVRGVREALRLPLSMSGLPITLFAAPFAGPGRDGNVLLGAQLVGDELKLAAGATLEVGYQAMTTEGRVTPGAIRQGSLSFSEAARRGVEETGLRILEHMTIPPGRHQVRFAVHQSDGKTGMVVADVDVPEFTKEALSMSGLVLSSEQTNKDQTLPGDLAMRMPIVPTAKRSFSRSDIPDGVRGGVHERTHSDRASSFTRHDLAGGRTNFP
jgi:hypothetical protein